MKGRLNHLSQNTGTFGAAIAAATWAIFTHSTGVKRGGSRSSSEYMIRGSAEKFASTGYRGTEISFKYETAPQGMADARLDALEDSYLNDTVLDIAATDRPVGDAGAKGTRGPFVVTDFERDESDENNTSYSITLKPVEHADLEVTHF